MASFVLSFFPLDVLDEIWDLIELVSEGFLTYSLVSLTFEDGRLALPSPILIKLAMAECFKTVAQLTVYFPLATLPAMAPTTRAPKSPLAKLLLAKSPRNPLRLP